MQTSPCKARFRALTPRVGRALNCPLRGLENTTSPFSHSILYRSKLKVRNMRRLHKDGQATSGCRFDFDTLQQKVNTTYAAAGPGGGNGRR